jgi:hypothetical protein
MSKQLLVTQKVTYALLTMENGSVEENSKDVFPISFLHICIHPKCVPRLH